MRNFNQKTLKYNMLLKLNTYILISQMIFKIKLFNLE